MAELRLIDANALPVHWGFISYDVGIVHGRFVAVDDIEDAPTIDAVPVVHARWEYSFGSYCTPKCSCCGWNVPYNEDGRLDSLYYCPNCGAKMDGGAEG